VEPPFCKAVCASGLKPRIQPCRMGGKGVVDLTDEDMGGGRGKSADVDDAMLGGLLAALLEIQCGLLMQLGEGGQAASHGTVTNLPRLCPLPQERLPVFPATSQHCSSISHRPLDSLPVFSATSQHNSISHRHVLMTFLHFSGVERCNGHRRLCNWLRP